MGAGATASVLWTRKLGANSFTYEVAEIGPDGSVTGKPTNIFGSASWDELSQWPILLPDGKAMVVVFQGGKGTTGPYSIGCIVGAVSGEPTWVLQSWSLSQSCSADIGGATVTKNGTLSAAWANGDEVHYRVGVSPTIPASTPDSDIVVPGNGCPAYANEVTELGGLGDIFVGWSQGCSSPSKDDGYYAKDLSGGPIMHAPGSGTASQNVAPSFALVPMASSTNGVVFMAYPSNTYSSPSMLLWLVGAKKAVVVPHATDVSDEAISTGPDGRIWVAWVNHKTQDVSTVRTNIADNAFGPVETYKTPCGELGDLALSGGNYGRLDIAMTCVNTASKGAIYVTQSLAGLSVRPSTHTIPNKYANNIDFWVDDAGDPVAGATVRVDGKTAKTDKTGAANFIFPKRSKPGRYTVTATAPNYYSAHATLVIVKGA